jgi:kinesin family protein 3/17
MVSSDNRENFKVVIRVRPPLPREIDSYYGFSPIVSVSPDHKQISVLEYLGAASNDMEREQDIQENPGLVTYHHFTFDYIYDQDSTQVQVYENTARAAVLSVLEGYNATLLAYGQTGTGKTYTMEGFKYNSTDPQRGIVPRASEEIFKFIESSQSANATFMVRASYLQIYNEFISDLLKPDRGTLQIREEKRRGVFVEGLSEWAVRSPADICSLMQKGETTRATASTKMNDVSSRSHAVFIIIVEHMIEGGEDGQEITVGKLNLVDLAGSERVRVTGATGKRLEESKKINQSLSALGNVIAALTDTKPRTHIPYRDSKLTRLLEDSLGGNCKTTMMAMISPAIDAFGESLSSIKFANRAKNIRNIPKINADIDQKTLLRKYEVELKKLRQELDQKNKAVFEMQRMIDEGRKFDRESEGPDIRSQEFISEKEEKRKLEEKIRLMNSQLLIGGKKLEETPQFITALEEKQKAIRKEYESKLQEIEKERTQIEEDKAQIDRYKQLLLRQRDIMIALTARLNERDETIIQLQEELDAYDRIHRETEENLDYKSNRCAQLENMLRVHKIQIPADETPELHYYKEPKRYPPYSTDTVTLDNESFVPLQMLTAEEKINELSHIIENQKLELDRMISSMNSYKQPSGDKQHKDLQQTIINLQSMNEKIKNERQAVASALENGVLGYLEAIYEGVQENSYSLPQLLEELEQVMQAISQSLVILNKSESKQAQLRIPKPGQPIQAAPSASMSSNTSSAPSNQGKSGGRRPLTVEEMLKMKRQGRGYE